MQRADFAGDAEQQRRAQHQRRQRHVPQQGLLQQHAAEGEQRTADDQPFKEALMRRVQTGDIAAGGHEGEHQAELQLAYQQAEQHRQAQHQRLSQCVVDFRVVDQAAPHGREQTKKRRRLRRFFRD